MTMGTYTAVRAVEESSYSVTPASALQIINASSIKMPQNRKRERPNVLTNGRRRYPSRILQKSGEGLTIAAPLQYENCLMFLEGLMNNSRSSAVSITGTDIAFVAATNLITSVAEDFDNLADGDLIYVTGAGAGTNANKWIGPLIKNDDGELEAPAGQIAEQTAGGSVTIRTRRLVDAETLKSYSLEYQLNKLTTMYRNALGQRVLSAKHAWSQGSWATEEYVLNGKTPSKAAATIGTGGPTAAVTAPFMNAVEDFQEFRFGGYGTTLNAVTVTKWEAMFKNILAMVYGLGSAGPSQVDVGPFDVDVNLSIYMDDNAKDFLDASDGDETLWAWWSLVDPLGNRIAYSLPAVKVDVDDVPVGGAEEQVAIDATLTSHDPSKDSGSDFVSAGFNHQAGIFFVPAA